MGRMFFKLVCEDASTISMPTIVSFCPMSRTTSSEIRRLITSCLLSSRRIYSTSVFALYVICISSLPLSIKNIYRNSNNQVFLLHINDLDAFMFVKFSDPLLLKIIDFRFSFSVASRRNIKSCFDCVSNFIFACTAFLSTPQSMRLDLNFHILILPPKQKGRHMCRLAYY